MLTLEMIAALANKQAAGSDGNNVSFMFDIMLGLDVEFDFMSQGFASFITRLLETAYLSTPPIAFSSSLIRRNSFDFMSIDTFEGVLSMNDRYDFINLDLYIENLLPMVYLME